MERKQAIESLEGRIVESQLGVLVNNEEVKNKNLDSKREKLGLLVKKTFEFRILTKIQIKQIDEKIVKLEKSFQKMFFMSKKSSKLLTIPQQAPTSYLGSPLPAEILSIIL